jgi:hypothetical protein
MKDFYELLEKVIDPLPRCRQRHQPHHSQTRLIQWKRGCALRDDEPL